MFTGMSLRLHYRPGTASMAPHAALAEIGVEYELVAVAAGKSSPDYLALNPSGKVPTLEDGELVVTESAAILLHLGDRFPGARLVPDSGSAERSQLYRSLLNQTNSLQPALMHVMYPERFGDTGVREAAVADAQEQFERLDAHLAARPWLVGDERTAADLFLFMLTRWGRHLDSPAWDRPNIRAHFMRTLALPGVGRMMDEQGLERPPFAAA
jgi:glutathione S-transferase